MCWKWCNNQHLPFTWTQVNDLPGSDNRLTLNGFFSAFFHPPLNGDHLILGWSPKNRNEQWSFHPGWLGYLRDCKTQFCRDCNRLLLGSLLTLTYTVLHGNHWWWVLITAQMESLKNSWGWGSRRWLSCCCWSHHLHRKNSALLKFEEYTDNGLSWKMLKGHIEIPLPKKTSTFYFFAQLPVNHFLWTAAPLSWVRCHSERFEGLHWLPDFEYFWILRHRPSSQHQMGTVTNYLANFE